MYKIQFLLLVVVVVVVVLACSFAVAANSTNTSTTTAVAPTTASSTAEPNTTATTAASSTTAPSWAPSPSPAGDIIVQQNCSNTVPRGSRFSVDLGFVFTSQLGLPLTITVATADGFPLPLSVRVSANASGFVNVRGTIADSAPLVLAFNASDNASSSAVAHATCSLVPVFVDLHFSAAPPPFALHVGTPFVIVVPLSMFESSSPYTITSVLQPGRFPLPVGVSFQPPNTLLGTIPAVGFFNWTVTASDAFNEAVGYILINCTNNAPAAVVPAPFDLGSAAAGQALSLQVEVSSLFVDPDDDPLRYGLVGLPNLPLWLSWSVAPGGLTKVPQTLTITGDVPATDVGKNISLQISCTDSWSTAYLNATLSIVANDAPVQTNSLAAAFSQSVNSSDPLSFNFSLCDFFSDPDAHYPLSATANVAPSSAGAYVTVRVDAAQGSGGGSGCRGPVISVSAIVSPYAMAVAISFTVSDARNMKTTSDAILLTLLGSTTTNGPSTTVQSTTLTSVTANVTTTVAATTTAAAPPPRCVGLCLVFTLTPAATSPGTPPGVTGTTLSPTDFLTKLSQLLGLPVSNLAIESSSPSEITIKITDSNATAGDAALVKATTLDSSQLATLGAAAVATVAPAPAPAPPGDEKKFPVAIVAGACGGAVLLIIIIVVVVSKKRGSQGTGVSDESSVAYGAINDGGAFAMTPQLRPPQLATGRKNDVL